MDLNVPIHLEKGKIKMPTFFLKKIFKKKTPLINSEKTSIKTIFQENSI